jgi:hypothetical protein
MQEEPQTTTEEIKPTTAPEAEKSEKKGNLSGFLPKSSPSVLWFFNKHATGKMVLFAAEPIVPFGLGVFISIYLLISGLVSGTDKGFSISMLWIFFGLYIIISTVSGGYKAESIMEK